MGKFANKDPMIGTRIAPPPPELIGFEDPSGFAAMGKPIPAYRKAAADNHCKAMGLTDPEQRWDCIMGMVNALQRDDPHRAMEHAIKYLDATGVYRLMAVLLATPKPADGEEPF